MIKKIRNFLLFLLLSLGLIIFYLSFFGLTTAKFNNKIKTEILNINKKINLELRDVTFLLDPKNFSINVKTYSPEILLETQKIELEYIKTNISLKSLYNKDFSIDDLQISTKAIKLKNIILFARSFRNSAELFVLERIIKNGFLVGDIKLNFDKNGKIKEDYEINGFIKNAKLDFFKKYTLKNINLLFNIKNNDYFLKELSTVFNEIEITSQSINIKKKNDLFLIKGELSNLEKEFDKESLKKLFSLELEKKLNIKNVNLISDNEFTFSVNKKFKIDNLSLTSTIQINRLTYEGDFLNLKKYLPNLNGSIQLKDHKIKLNYKQNKIDVTGNGKFLIDDKLDKIDYKIIKTKDNYTFDTNIDINTNILSIDILNFKKKEDLDSVLKIKGFYNKNKEIRFNLISFKEKNNFFLIEDLNLDKNFKLKNLKKLNLTFVNKHNVKNQISLAKKKNKYLLKGQSLDLSVLISDILGNNNNEENSSILSEFNSNFDIDIKKVYLDKTIYVKNLFGDINFQNNKVQKLNLKSNFPNNKKLNLTINTNENKEQITTLYSDYPKPLIGQYKFIKGFEEGILDFYSIKKGNISNSVLKIDNFKIQEVPILAKLLTLASLQGIADLLTGEGIRFTDFEMKFSNEKNIMKIEELYSIGPAISILMDGYIESKKLISLRGTLVPATTINRTISSIPLIGDILVGKKIGEGVFGVSFKVKGSPDDLKTTVNPIKTLTPRFITRTLEKIKKN